MPATTARPASATPRLLLAASLALAIGYTFWGGSASAEEAVKLPPPAIDAPASAAATETAVFAGGCFWGVQAVFQHTEGVLNAVSGYTGGAKETARYETITSGLTGHAEAVQVTYDPKRISYGKLLQVLFSVAHDPTQLNRQGPDTGTQYRSAVFTQGTAQQDVARRYIEQLDAARAFPAKIVTEVAPLTTFYPAEAYHQDYATRNPTSPYIVRFDQPKIGHLKALLPEVYRDKPVLVAGAAKR